MPAHNQPLAKRIFQSLLKLFPFDFRSDFGGEMEEVFDAQRADAERQGRVGIFRLWWETLTGIFTTAPREHWEMLKQDAGYALRMMGRNKAFTLAAALTLGLGIGANTAIFSVVHSVLLKPLPYGQGPRLVRLRQAAPKLGRLNIGFSEKELKDYQNQSQTLEQIAEYHSMSFILIGEEPRRVQTGVVSYYYFQMMGVRPELGRDFTKEDDDKGEGEGEGVLLLSNRYWEKEFRGDPNIVGRKFQMNNRPHTVIGVLPALPGYPNDNDVYMPVSHCPFRSAKQTRENRNARMTFLFARMKPGVREEQALAELSTIAARFPEQYPANYPKDSNFTARVTSMKEELTQNARQTFLILLGTAGLVLLIACANVANLMLSRVLRRERELGVRAALGASRVRLMRQLLTESVMLSLLGGGLGLALAVSSTSLLTDFAARFTPRAAEISMSVSVLLFTLGVSVLTGLVFGSLPAMSSAQDVFSALRDGSRTIGGARNRLRSTLIVAQVALSFVLLIGAGLMGQSFLRMQSMPGGYDPENVLSARVDLNFSKYQTPIDSHNFWIAMFQKLEADPEIVSYSVASEFPMLAGVSPGNTPFQIQSRPTNQGDLPNLTDTRLVSRGYLKTIGIPLLMGRMFGPEENQNSPRVVAVNHAFAQKFFPKQEILGQRVSLGSPGPNGPVWAEIIGVVGDVREAGLDKDEYAAIYQPFEQTPFGNRILVRTTGDPLQMVEQLRRAVREIDPHQPIDSFQTLAAARGESLANPRLTTMLMGLFSLLALAITATGITGVMALWVNQRTREIGIRMAMGASRSGVLTLVMRQGLTMVVIGVAMGVAGAYGMSGMLKNLLFSIEASDPATFAAVAAVLVGCATLACWLPARRASRIDPIIALRAE